MTVWRIVKATRAATAFEGEGARINGGRWNSPGRAAVYVSATKSLALLEILVHLEALDVPKRWVAFRVPIDAAQIEMAVLPPEWPARTAHTQSLGDDWLESRRTLALAVPSVVVPEEFNYLLNPAHPDFHKLEFGNPLPFTIDLRLVA